MLYELRIYHCAPGKLGALNRRFEEVTLGLWEKFMIHPVDLHYPLGFNG